MDYTGDGWAIGIDDSRRWGTLGAAGLFLTTFAPDNKDQQLVLMQHRATWTNRGDTWALPGGAIDVGETPEAAALRETWEETGVTAEDVTVEDVLVTTSVELDHVLKRVPIEPADEHLIEPIVSMIERSGDVRGALNEHPIIHPQHGGRAVFGLNAQFWWVIKDDSYTQWTYSTVMASAEYPLELFPTAESADLKWWPVDQLEALPLMPEFKANLPQLREYLATTNE